MGLKGTTFDGLVAISVTVFKSHLSYRKHYITSNSNYCLAFKKFNMRSPTSFYNWTFIMSNKRQRSPKHIV